MKQKKDYKPLILIILFFALFFLGYWVLFLQVIFSINKSVVLRYMWPYRTQKIQGTYLFHSRDQIFFWGVLGIYRMNILPNDLLQYNDRCSPSARLGEHKYAYFNDIIEYEYGNDSLNKLSKFKFGSPIIFQTNVNGSRFISVFNYIPEINNLGRLICIN